MRCEINPFVYELPKERIAQRPVYPPDAAKMMVVNRANGSIFDSTFRELPALLSGGYHLVFNDTRVIPARLFGKNEGTGAEVELLLVHRVSGDASDRSVTWLCIGRPLKRIRKAERITFSDGLYCTVVDSSHAETVTVCFRSEKEAPVEDLLARVGIMPIPPYIRNGLGDETDKTDYQTIFAEHPGSVAAPTASLHFTPQMVEAFKASGDEISYLTLHVGTASFQPVLSNGEFRPPASEELYVPEKTRHALARSRAANTKIVGVGTTVTRALESASRGVGEGTTDLFITPGFIFTGIDVLVTNFHQPGTTHLLLVEAFVGRELLEKMYSHGLQHGYRFLSYGDGMVIL
jgi:S-adenosylmethionine:tRNA ribosyltransferase-isomerase